MVTAEGIAAQTSHTFYSLLAKLDNSSLDIRFSDVGKGLLV
jgi:hypothetical protein